MKKTHRIGNDASGEALARAARALLIATGLLLVAAATTPAGAADAADLAAQVEAGRKGYTSYCVRCHGIRLASSGIGTDLRTFKREDRERFDRSVLKGLRAMPAWEGVLKPGELDALWAYVGSVNGWGDPTPAKP